MGHAGNLKAWIPPDTRPALALVPVLVLAVCSSGAEGGMAGRTDNCMCV